MPLPDAEAIEALIDAGFWASLQREEGYAPEISLAFLPPERAIRPLMFAPPLPLGPRALAQLAPAVERPGIHLGVWRQEGELRVWGTTRAIPTSCFVLEVVAPGLLVVKHRIHEDSPKFRNVAVFEGEQVKILSQEAAPEADYPELLRPLLGPESAPGRTSPSTSCCGSPSPCARTSAGAPCSWSPRAPRRGASRSCGRSPTPSSRRSPSWPTCSSRRPTARPPDYGALGRVVDAVAGLTAVDGATLITDRYELLAFGVKIGRPDGRLRVERVTVSEPIEGGTRRVVAPLQLGGTRHISAAQFAQDQQDAVALVASQDGRFTVFAWSPRDRMVHAHRVETLLL